MPRLIAWGKNKSCLSILCSVATEGSDYVNPKPIRESFTTNQCWFIQGVSCGAQARAAVRISHIRVLA
jgi:hypothetical protein